MSASSGSIAQRVLVSYSAPPTFLASPNWDKVYATLVAQLPLRNIHRKHSLRQSVKTIQTLDVTLVALDAVSEEPTSQVPSTVLEKPLLHLFILHCEVIQLCLSLVTLLRIHVNRTVIWNHTEISTRNRSRIGIPVSLQGRIQSG